MKNHNYRTKLYKSFRLFAFLIPFFFIACKTYSFEAVPYVMTGDFVMEDNSSDYEICGVDLFLLNKSEKEITKLNIVFFLFDHDGEPAFECQNKISVELERSVSAGDTSSFCISLDQFLNSVPEENLLVDYLYLAKIDYADGSVWEDPYGLVAFR